MESELRFMIADSQAAAKRGHLQESRRLLVDATQPGELQNEREGRHATIITFRSEE